jgi:hypothetical protein
LDFSFRLNQELWNVGENILEQWNDLHLKMCISCVGTNIKHRKISNKVSLPVAISYLMSLAKDVFIKISKIWSWLMENEKKTQKSRMSADNIISGDFSKNWSLYASKIFCKFQLSSCIFINTMEQNQILNKSVSSSFRKKFPLKWLGIHFVNHVYYDPRPLLTDILEEFFFLI